MTYDELIARDLWKGEDLTLRQRMADYTVDGMRLGRRELRTRSGSQNDISLEKRTGEILTAALVLARIGHEHVALISLDAKGKTLERPDLDARLANGLLIGLEVADVVATDEAKHDASVVAIETHVRDLLDNDQAFREAFGSYHVSINLNAVGSSRDRISSKKEAGAIRDELIAFFRAGKHTLPADEYFSDFGDECPTLRTRGAQLHADLVDGYEYFSLNEGSSVIGPGFDQRAEALRVLNEHRRVAKNYRKIPTWLILFLTDSFEFFRNTISAIATINPPVEPFTQAYVADSAGRLLKLP